MKFRIRTFLRRAVVAGSVAALLGTVVGPASAGHSRSKPGKYGKHSFCGRYVATYEALYNASTTIPPSEPLVGLEAGVIEADGKGNIKEGELTENALGAGPVPDACTITGNQTYTVGDSPLGAHGYVSFDPQYTCYGSTCDPGTGLCTITPPPSPKIAQGNIQFACYLSDPDGDELVCTGIGSFNFTSGDVSISALGRAVTWTRADEPDFCTGH